MAATRTDGLDPTGPGESNWQEPHGQTRLYPPYVYDADRQRARAREDTLLLFKGVLFVGGMIAVALLLAWSIANSLPASWIPAQEEKEERPSQQMVDSCVVVGWDVDKCIALGGGR